MAGLEEGGSDVRTSSGLSNSKSAEYDLHGCIVDKINHEILTNSLTGSNYTTDDTEAM